MSTQVQETTIDGNTDKGDHVYATIREIALRHTLAPGTQLAIKPIAEQLKVSATPVREALKRLSHDGIIGLDPGNRYYIKTPTIDSVRDMYENALAILLFSIENNISHYQNKAITIPSFFKLKSDYVILDEILIDNYTGFVESIYEAIANLSGNRLMIWQIQEFNSRTRFIREIDLRQPRRLSIVSRKMCDLIADLENQDKKAALDNIRWQYDAKIEQLERLLEKVVSRSVQSQTDLGALPIISAPNQ